MSNAIDSISAEVMVAVQPQLWAEQIIIEVMGLSDGDYSFNNGYSTAFNVLPPGLGVVADTTTVEVLGPTNLPGRMTTRMMVVEVLGKANGVFEGDKVIVEVLGKAKVQAQVMTFIIEALGEKRNLCNGTL